MRETRRSGNYPCQTILQTLKFQDGIDSNIVIKGITIVKSTANENNCNSFGDSKRHLPANTTRVTNVIKATTIPLIIITVLQSICVKFKLLSETEVTPICQQTNCWPLRVGMCIAVFKDSYNTPGGGRGCTAIPKRWGCAARAPWSTWREREIKKCRVTKRELLNNLSNIYKCKVIGAQREKIKKFLRTERENGQKQGHLRGIYMYTSA